ncbi:Na+/H+ antiporter subunit E [Natribacillus halophilus]|uniref:Multisubunit sodium/proton antiporter, MrpE subunit n=1 Tax=Natribacillus halophilus TaxID=549003 RepID=A0A1G8JVE9_9BACI|nr:Na+/H+ antiporter subunit E [Natribacillus halophilus]SDI35073.1 multisubunit sodium/proton antiporter, MrpE subunit [Natribacillus halophilus]
MAFQILLNIVIAIFWMALQGEYTSVNFVIGYVIGLGVVYFLRGSLNETFYMRRVWAIIKLIVIFIKELVVANLDMIRIVLSPKLNVTPGIIALRTDLKTDWEITILSMCITLTPGTMTMDYSQDGRTLYIHSIHMNSTQEVIDDVRNNFERAIQEVTK